MSIEQSSLTMDCTTLPMFKYYTLKCLNSVDWRRTTGLDYWTTGLAWTTCTQVYTYLPTYLPRADCTIIKIMVGNYSFQVSSWVQ